MASFRGLTWDHPRGYNALAAAASAAVPRGLHLTWDRQPLEGFEAHPIADLCERYDLVVLDHPHIGEAIAAACLRPLETMFSAADINGWQQTTVGACFASYRYGGQHWALPLDAATQVMATRPALLAGPPPETWDEVEALSAGGGVAMSVAGPHALLSLFSIAAALGVAPAAVDPERLLSADIAVRALDILALLYARMPAAARPLNPMGLLGLMASSGAVALCPLVFGYVNYAAPRAGEHPVAFRDAPAGMAGGKPGTTVGGTGLAVSRRCAPTPHLLDHLKWLLSAEAQRGFIPEHDGQPSRRDAWTDAGVNARSADFYRNTQRSIEAAWVRPRYPGYMRFQMEASSMLHADLENHSPPKTTAARLQDLYARSRTAGSEL